MLFSILESQTDEVVMLDAEEVKVENSEPEYDEAMKEEDEGMAEEGQAIDNDGDPDWTPEEAENAYKRAGDDECDQKPNPQYAWLLFFLSINDDSLAF